MQFETSPAALARGLAAIAGVTEWKNTVPILANVKLEAREGGKHVIATATNMDIDSSVRIEAWIRSPGATTASFRQLVRIAGAFRAAASLTAELKDDGLHVASTLAGLDLGLDDGQFKARLRTLPVADLPVPLCPGDLSHTIKAPAKTWLIALRGLWPFISTEATRYYLNGIHIAPLPPRYGTEPLRWEAVATDGHALGKVRFGAASASAPIKGVIIPRAAVAHLIQRLQLVAPAEEIELAVFGENHVAVDLPDGGRMVARLIDGTFPDYERVIPSRTNKVVQIVPRHVMRTVRAAIRASQVPKPTASIHLGPKTIMNVDLEGEEHRTGSLPLPINWQGPAAIVGMNLKLLTHGLALMDGCEATMQVDDPASPILFDATTSPDDIERTAVAMPMRV